MRIPRAAIGALSLGAIALLGGCYAAAVGAALGIYSLTDSGGSGASPPAVGLRELEVSTPRTPDEVHLQFSVTARQGGKLSARIEFVVVRWLDAPGPGDGTPRTAFPAPGAQPNGDRVIDLVNDLPDQGCYLYRGGEIHLVAHTGTVIPGAGTVVATVPPDFLQVFPRDFPWPYSGGALNNLGQILIALTVRDSAGELAMVLVVATPKEDSIPTFRRGDADGKGDLELTDAVYLLAYLFLEGTKPPCLDAADADDSGEIDLTDAVYSLAYLFLGEAPPPKPGPSACGPDPTVEPPDDLDCSAGC